MKVVIRADASLQIGIGHVMRCLTLADALKSRGVDVRFICRAHPGHLKDLIKDRGYQVYLLSIIKNYQASGSDDLSHANWLGASWEQDAKEISSIIENINVDWIIVDHYALDARWESSVRKKNCRIMVIDDIADRIHDCSLLLDQTYNRNEAIYKSLVPDNCLIMTGSEYALLRPEFSGLRKFSLQRRTTLTIEHVLITMGGVDQHNVTSKILDILLKCNFSKNCHISIVLGSTSPWVESIKVDAKKLRWSTDVLVNVDNIAQLMADSDLCIGAAGSTAWERCCLGLPTMMVVTANNQKEIAASLSKTGACIYLGDYSDDDFKERTISKINAYIKDSQLQKSIIESASKVTNGEGVKFILTQLLSEEKNENYNLM